MEKNKWDSHKQELNTIEKQINKNINSLQQSFTLFQTHYHVSMNQDLEIQSTNKSQQMADKSKIVSLQNELQKQFENIQYQINVLSRNQNVTTNFVQNNIVQRYKQNASDNQKLFNKLQAQIEQYFKKQYLMNYNNTQTSSSKEPDEEDKHLLDENNQLKQSFNHSSQIVNQAQQVKSNYDRQRMKIQRVDNKSNSIVNSFGGINQLVQGIQYARRKNEIVLGTVIAICILICIKRLFF